MDFKWVDETLDTLQEYVHTFSSAQRPLIQLRWILGEKVDEEPEDRAKLSRERFERLEEMMAKSEGKPRESMAQHKSLSRGLFSPSVKRYPLIQHCIRDWPRGCQR